MNLADAYSSMADRTTLYISDTDHALEASKWLHNYARAGLYPPITVMPTIDTIAVSDIDVTLLGHGYFAEAAPVLYDIKTLLQTNAPPDSRVRTRPMRTGSGERYWSLSP